MNDAIEQMLRQRMKRGEAEDSALVRKAKEQEEREAEQRVRGEDDAR